MCALTVCSLVIGEWVAKKGRSPGRSHLDHSCSLIDPHGSWKDLMQTSKVQKKKKKKNPQHQLWRGKTKKPTWDSFACLYPESSASSTFWKCWRDLFLKKRKKLEWFGMMVGAADSFLCPWVFTARKSWPTSIAKGLPSHIVVKLGEKISRILCVRCNYHRVSKTGTWGFIWGDRGSRGGRVTGWFIRAEFQRNCLHGGGRMLRIHSVPRSWGTEVIQKLGRWGTVLPHVKRGWLYILVICVCTGAGGLSRCPQISHSSKESQPLGSIN